MSKVIDINLPFEELFTKSNEELYREAFNQKYLSELRVSVLVPVSMVKSSYIESKEHYNFFEVPVYIYINTVRLAETIVKELGVDVSKEEALDRAIGMLMEKQCQMVRDILITH